MNPARRLVHRLGDFGFELFQMWGWIVFWWVMALGEHRPWPRRVRVLFWLAALSNGAGLAADLACADLPHRWLLALGSLVVLVILAGVYLHSGWIKRERGAS